MDKQKMRCADCGRRVTQDEIDESRHEYQNEDWLCVECAIVAFSAETVAYEGNALLPDGLHLCYPIFPDDVEEVTT